MLVGRSSPFGGQTRTRVLLVLSLLAQSYARELARLLGVSLNAVQVALRGLERDGLVAAQPMGRTRLYTLDPRYFARDELVRYLRRLAQPETDLQDRVAALRRRPRRTGKPA
ncbi:MAG TPA: winged helix-turn-helix domain-containing protein [Verrucomicrobiae bacterium]|nr:winged helix-turn-helix domain-containing protein [Verrucomicrobiae bacterium]